MKRFSWGRMVDGEFELVSAEEEIAHVVAGVKADLEYRGVTDPRVWGDGRPPYAVGGSDGEAVIHEDIGMFGTLERAVRGDPGARMAGVVQIAFELGRASIVGKPGHGDAVRFVDAHKRRIDGAKKAGNATGPAIRRDAAKGHEELKKIWNEEHYRLSGGKLLDLARAKLLDLARTNKSIPKLSRERIKGIFADWAKEEKWAAGWGAVGDEYHQVTRDNYRVALFHENGRWRLRCKARTGWNGTLTKSGTLEEMKDAGYKIVENFRKKARDEARYRKTYDWEDQA